MLIPQGEMNDLWDLKQEIMNYYVIDFDFLNQPTIIPFKEYLEHMFMTKSLKNNKEKILKDLNLSLMSFDIVDAEKYVLFSKNGQSELSLIQKKQVILAEDLKFRDIYKF